MDQIPSSPLNSSSTEWRYDVFLSFRGEDTRTGFTDHLYAALVDKGIRTFRDSEELRRGEEIEGELLKAIHESRIFIIIFSEDYANSKWCLKELAEISKCKAKGRKVFPVFYHVDPSEVRNQSGYYGEAFAAYENDANQDSERIQVWRTALKEAGHIIGYHIDKEPEADVVKTITRDMICEIIGKDCVEDGLVDKKSRLKKLKELIWKSEDVSMDGIRRKSRDVLMVGIFGSAGIGKTTIARALYDEISCQFDGASFLANIREGIHALIEGISLELSKSKDKKFSGEAFSEMDALRLLKVFLGSGCVNDKETYKVHFSTDFTFPSYDKLRYLHGHGYQLDSFPSNFEAEELLELNMPCSSLKQIKGDEIHFPNLIALDLSHSQQLETISNFSRMPNLERLVLEGCRSLVKVDPSIVNLKKLSLMNLKGCKRLKSLPKRICKFKFLETLILTGCSRLEKLLGDREERQNSVNLKASRTYRRVIILPPALRILHLGHCKRFQEILKLPSSIQEVDAYNCISMGTLSWNTRLEASILQRIKVSLSLVKLCYFQGRTLLSFS
ncbi:hypothetical protein VitviT2T_028773 [Vitis vinifera]|uniref:TIR domain-containing protein n=1 Tax=Vitis vinifera TaxID=29760 RepID=A0ABY9DUL0_VITVI|nr:hypothetical protein VitviT2T_028773 [Vitis vinifera]